ncbi:MAG: hypothetical protein AABY64_08030 [Bdellovibrionota bacterium]
MRNLSSAFMTLFVSILIGFSIRVSADTPLVGRDVGKDVASGYFQKRAVAEAPASSDHYLALHVGKIMNGDAWEWGMNGRQTEMSGSSFGVTYRLEESEKSMDVNLRVDFNEYDVVGEKPLKMSLMPLWIFPEASSKFPLYFGFGAGLGVFFKQVKDESALSFDYQLIAGARFFNIYENTGFFIETGLKNHLQILSSGQFNGTFLSTGAVFTF